jgi:O-antigen ligase
MPYYIDIFNENLDLRKSKFESSLTDEGRYIENIAVINIITESPISFFWGTGEVFNSRGKYGIYEDRMLHNDYANIIWSSGILGACLYFGLFIRLFLFFYRSYKYRKTTYAKTYSLIGVSIIIAYFACAVGQAWTSISIMSFTMLNLGMFYRKVQILNIKKMT